MSKKIAGSKSNNKRSIASKYITTEAVFKHADGMNRFQFVNHIVDLMKRQMYDAKQDGERIDPSYLLSDVFSEIEEQESNSQIQ